LQIANFNHQNLTEVKMVKRSDGRKRKPHKRRNSYSKSENTDGAKNRRKIIPKRKFNNINSNDIDYIEAD